LELIDVGDIRQYEVIIDSAIMGCDGILLIFALNDRGSFNNAVSKHYQKVMSFGKEYTPIILVCGYT
jgi:GTPase SAR1 family protein